jgi:Plasma-membrane choline transporter
LPEFLVFECSSYGLVLRALQNLIQITVAGVIGTWCYARDEADHCCSFAIWSSLYRSLTYSFGSVCLGSLLQALVRLFRVIVEHARDQRDRNDSCEGCGSLLLCVLECIASLLEDLIYIFNQYAYIYAGIYGTSYVSFPNGSPWSTRRNCFPHAHRVRATLLFFFCRSSGTWRVDGR